MSRYKQIAVAMTDLNILEEACQLAEVVYRRLSPNVLSVSAAAQLPILGAITFRAYGEKIIMGADDMNSPDVQRYLESLYGIAKIKREAKLRGYRAEVVKDGKGVIRLVLHKIGGDGHRIECGPIKNGDGRSNVDAVVRGIAGPACAAASAWLDRIGKVVVDQGTDDAFKTTAQNQIRQ